MKWYSSLQQKFYIAGFSEGPLLVSSFFVSSNPVSPQNYVLCYEWPFRKRRCMPACHVHSISTEINCCGIWAERTILLIAFEVSAGSWSGQNSARRLLNASTASELSTWYPVSVFGFLPPETVKPSRHVDVKNRIRLGCAEIQQIWSRCICWRYTNPCFFRYSTTWDGCFQEEGWKTPPNHPFVHRVFPYFHHPFLGVKSPYFWKQPEIEIGAPQFLMPSKA